MSKGTYRCVDCGHRGPRRHFRSYVKDVEAGVASRCRCQRCRQPPPLDYEHRNRMLKVLGFNSYAHYRASEMWATFRKMVLDRDARKCVVCGGAASEVHHNSYEMDVLVGKDLAQLVSLCRRHHEGAEFDESGRKRELPEVREELARAGVRVPDLVRRGLPACCKPKPFDPLEGLSPKERKKIIERANGVGKSRRIGGYAKDMNSRRN